MRDVAGRTAVEVHLDVGVSIRDLSLGSGADSSRPHVVPGLARRRLDGRFVSAPVVSFVP
jgi:hypothetical protein